jgi:hypothetical protein
VTMFGIDATSTISPAALHSVGVKFVVRYLSRYSWKVITRAEYNAYDAAGILVALVFEDGAQNALGGYDAGKADAEFAKSQALSILPPPSNLAAMLPAAVDYDPAGGAGRTDAYFDGQAAVLSHRIAGPYGGDEVISRQANRGFEGLYPTYAWSGGRRNPKGKIFQYSNGHTVGGVGCDFDQAFDLTAFWNYKAQPADPHGYLKYFVGPFDDAHPFKNVNERFTVERYDTLRAMQGVRHPHRKEINHLKVVCGALADRIKRNAVRDGSPVWGDGDWTSFHRMFRYRGLVARSKGQRVV